MTIELLYTSAAQGLKQGSRGFCTVVCTAGLPINLAQRLEALSGYRHLYQPGDQRADDNPVCHSHIRLAVGGKTLSILSRVGAYGVDYSQRTNKIAHHVVFDGAVPACGPAAVLSQSGIMRTNWDGECKTLQSGPQVPPIALHPAPCQEWKRITGDAGWAGVVANAWLQPTGKPVWIVFSESHSQWLLELMQEATAILPESQRWQATFSTFCTNLPPDVDCRVRCVIAGSDEARMSIARGTVLDLTKPLGLAPNNDATEAARNGYTVGSTSKLVQSIEELNNLSDQTSEDIESALSMHSSDESEYRLKPQIPGRLPIPLAMPSRRPGNEVKRRGSKSPSRQSKIWKVLAAASGVLIFFSLVGTGVFYFATKKNPTSGNVENVQAGKSEHNVGSNGERPAEFTGTGNGGTESKEPVPPAEIQLSLDQKIFKINENERILPNFEVATVKVDNAKLSDLKILVDPDVFKLDIKGEVCRLIMSENAQFDFESTKKVMTEIGIGDIKEKIEIDIENLPEPNLGIVVTRTGESTRVDSVFSNESLTAKSMGEDSDGPKNLEFLWFGRKDTLGEWEQLVGADKEEYTVSPDYSQIYCQLKYESSIPDATVIESKKINVKKIGTATLYFHELFFATNDKPCVLRFENTFNNLPVLNKDQVFHAELHKVRKQLDGNTLKFTVDLEMVQHSDQNQSNYLELPSDYSDVKSLGTANPWLQDACTKSIEVRQSLQNLIRVLKSMPNTSKLSAHFKRFVRELKESPSDSFVRPIVDFNSWLEELRTFNSFSEKPPEPKKERKNDADKSQDEIKFERLQSKFSSFSNAFSNTPFMSAQNEIADNEVAMQVRSFWKDLNHSTSTSGMTMTMKGEWPKLHESIIALKRVMEDFAQFEVDIESASPIRILKLPKKQDPATKIQEVQICKDTFRVKLKVDFSPKFKP